MEKTVSKVEITIETDNDAFQPAPNIELARILREIAINLEYNAEREIIRDINGNTVGHYKSTD